jgi:hypothetical protein
MGGDRPGTAGAGGGELGFSFRVPGPMDRDWLCTFHRGAELGHVYARVTQTGTKMAGIATVPVYEVVLAQMSMAGAVVTLANPVYDHGGGHNNDWLQFDSDGQTYRYYHSSFGFGFRKCQPMDCLNVYALGGTTPQTEGCGLTRTRPEVCVPIKPDGTHDPLVDTFMKCPGDTRQ